MLLWAVQQELKEQSEVGVLLVAAAPGKTALKTCGICYSLCNSSLERCYIVLHIKVWRVALREKNSPLRKELLPTACYHPCCSSDLSRSPEVHIGGCLPCAWYSWLPYSVLSLCAFWLSKIELLSTTSPPGGLQQDGGGGVQLTCLLRPWEEQGTKLWGFEQLMLDLFIPGSSGTRKCCKPRAIASTYSLTSQPTRASPSGSRGLHLLGKQSRQELTMREDKWPSEKE